MNPSAVPSNVWCGLPCEVDELVRVNLSNDFVFRNKKMGMVPVIGPNSFAHPSEWRRSMSGPDPSILRRSMFGF
jgi:hypothetical protein